ncbi:MAG: hypothetical protein VXZ96_05740 [Myxococcota bacterium]|nr:hypothetical protein [Myxococcota bacterium]MEC8379800.1 hypothetical protein [Myxococcota bacterium]
MSAKWMMILVGGLSCMMSACGPDCQSTCNRLYLDPGAGGCGIERPGTTIDDRLTRCMEECEYAMDRPGDAGSYNPNEQIPRSETVELENDEMAALWMDCIEETACENLEQNYCAPIW